MTERRAVSRHRTYLRGVMSFQNGTTSEDCLVRNVSDGGAMIELPHPHAPESFALRVDGRDISASARVVWRHGLRFGLTLNACAPAPAARPRLRDEGY